MTEMRVMDFPCKKEALLNDVRPEFNSAGRAVREVGEGGTDGRTAEGSVSFSYHSEDASIQLRVGLNSLVSKHWGGSVAVNFNPYGYSKTTKELFINSRSVQ